MTFDPTATVVSFVASLQERERDIVTRRTFSATPLKLDEIGKDYRLTRERIRQLEKPLKDELARRLEPALARATELPDVVAAADLATSLGWAGEHSGIEGVTVGDVVMAVAGRPRREEWYVRAGHLDTAVAKARSRCKKPKPVADVAPGMTPGSARRWLQRCDIDILTDGTVTARASIADQAVAFLTTRGTPATMQDLFGAVSSQNIFSTNGAILTDDRIVRVGPHTWGLVAWGMEPYRDMVVELGDLIDTFGGAVPVADAASLLCDQFGVQESSVRAYAAAHPAFTVTDGVVRRRTVVGEAPTARHDRHVYALPDGWTCVRAATEDVLRGVSVSVPEAFAGAVGAVRGGPDVEAGAFVMGWRSTQPQVRTLRAQLRSLGVQHGDLFALDMRSGTGTLRVVRPTAEPGVPRALEIIGLDPAGGLAALAAAVGADPGADLDTVTEHLVARRDTLLLEAALGIGSRAAAA